MTETEKFTDFTDMHTPTLSVQLRFLYNYPQVFDNKDFDVDLRGYAKFSIIRYSFFLLHKQTSNRCSSQAIKIQAVLSLFNIHPNINLDSVPINKAQ